MSSKRGGRHRSPLPVLGSWAGAGSRRGPMAIPAGLAPMGLCHGATLTNQEREPRLQLLWAQGPKGEGTSPLISQHCPGWDYIQNEPPSPVTLTQSSISR